MSKDHRFKNDVKKRFPTLSELLGLDKFNITYSQRCDCISLYNHYGEERAIEQAKKFERYNSE